MIRTSIRLALAGAAVCGCGPRSLADALVDRNDEFPRNSVVLVPASDVDRLGQTVEDLGHRRARPTGDRCFDVAPVTGHGLSKIELTYKQGPAFKAEVKELAAQAGGEVTDDDKATIALEDLTVREGFGVPIRTACGFHDGVQTVDVITSTVIAGRARIAFSRNITFKANGGGGWTTGKASGSASGAFTSSGELEGTGIVIVASVTPVTVKFTDTQQDLGATPTPGTVIAFPRGYDGNVRIDGLRTDTPDGVPVLDVTANTRMNASAQTVPAALTACTVGQRTSLRPGQGCFVWNENGASGVNVWFEPKTTANASHVVVHLDGYESRFTPAKPAPG